MDFPHHCFTTFNVTKRSFRATIFPHLEIKFNLFFRNEYYHYVINQDSRLQCLPSSDNSTAAHVIIVRGQLRYEDVREALGNAIGGRLHENECRRAIMLAWEEVRKAFITLPKHTVFDLDLKIWTTHVYLYVVYPRMSLPLLEKCDEEGCCCICLEELGGVALRRMPCSHVFHGGCIKEWLRKSRYCPLCRYQMPAN
ncbi:uncharacterized protein LOC131024562 [Salvia miltiorrhiza]|uniref:uncharacterized protein LOC131024562 n=1 Tax=Salvia miltiorrhiza TaxID=226208 RepID=UPI0025ABA2A6|nr:uncharacterized protein LOC131024562 [Salvia miltiorrhiza]